MSKRVLGFAGMVALTCSGLAAIGAPAAVAARSHPATTSSELVTEALQTIRSMRPAKAGATPGTGSTTTASSNGFTTASTGTRTISSRTITVSNVTLNTGETLTITYGDRGLGGQGATAPSSPIVQIWPTAEKSTTGGVLTGLATSPS